MTVARNGPGLFWRYCIVGSIAAGIHFLVLIALVEGLSADPTLASAVGFCVAVTGNYLMQYFWTFSARDRHGTAFVRFSLIACFALAINTAVFSAMYTGFQVPYLIAQAIATGLVVMLNFSLNRRFVFVSQVESS